MTPFRKIVVGTLLAIFSLIVSFYYKPVPPRNIMPESAVNAAIKAGLMTSPVFHDFGYGGYLIYRGIPVYIDGRADMYGSEFTATYNRVNEQVNIGEFKQMLDSNLIAWTLLPANSHLVRYLENLSDWTLLFKDENTVVYKRNGTR